MVNSISKPADTYVSTFSIDELRAQHEIAKCLKETDQALVKLETAVQSDVKDRAEMQQAQKCAALFHRVANRVVMNQIFSFLPLENLAQINRVSKNWNKYASYRSLWNSSAMCKQFRALKILDEDTWKTHVDLEKFGLETDDIPPLDKRAIIPTLKRLMALPIEDDRGITLLTIPKGLTLNKLAEIVKAPKKGNALDGIDRVIDIRDYIKQIPGNDACLKTYRVAITNSILANSRGMSNKELSELVHAYSCRRPNDFPQTLRSMSDEELRNLVKTYACQLPEVLPVATLCALKYISSLECDPNFRYLGMFDGIISYPSCLPTYTLCADTSRDFNLETAVQGDEERLKKNQESSIIVGRINQYMAGRCDQGTWKENNSNASIEWIRGLQHAVGVAAQWKFTDSSSSSHEAVTKQQQVITSNSQPSNASAAANEIISSS